MCNKDRIERLRAAVAVVAELADKRTPALDLFKRLYMELKEAEAEADPVMRALAKLERRKAA